MAVNTTYIVLPSTANPEYGMNIIRILCSIHTTNIVTENKLVLPQIYLKSISQFTQRGVEQVVSGSVDFKL